jgi:hypothetical protein
MQQHNDIRFEIRKGVTLASKHNAMIQAGYDTIDRLANLLGHINFGTLFGEPLADVVPQILPHIDRVAGYGLIDDPAAVTELFESLQQHHGTESFASLAARICDDDGAAFPKAAYTAVYELWHFHGIKLPEIARKLSVMEDVQQGIREVMQHIPDFSYRSIWEVGIAKDLKTARIALRRAQDFNVIYLIHPNGLCCGLTQCILGLSTNFCASFNGQCAAGSSECDSFQGRSEGDCGCC